MKKMFGLKKDKKNKKNKYMSKPIKGCLWGWGREKFLYVANIHHPITFNFKTF